MTPKRKHRKPIAQRHQEPQGQALAHFRWVKEHGNPTNTEYTIAVAELDRLEQQGGQAKR